MDILENDDEGLLMVLCCKEEEESLFAELSKRDIPFEYIPQSIPPDSIFSIDTSKTDAEAVAEAIESAREVPN